VVITSASCRRIRRSFAGGFYCFLVASPPVRDLLLCAKHLFVEAMVGLSPAFRSQFAGEHIRTARRQKKDS